MSDYIEENDPIIIDIKNIDIKKEEMKLQYEAYEDLQRILNTQCTKIEKSKKIQDCRSHNSIFVNGNRGSGKTQFIISIEKYLKNTDETLWKNFYFFNPIDPTLLHDNESFLTIIIAKILNNLEQSGELKAMKDDKKKSFYSILSSLSEAIDGVVQNKNSDKTSLECISQDQTSLMLEQYLHEFFKMVSKVVNKNRLIILIDDVDMAFDKGFEVLEVIRKYLASPFIIPIVTGHYDLYEYIVTHELSSKNKMERFMESDNDNLKEVFQKKSYRKLMYSTSTDYLIKVFPQDKRVNIKKIIDIAKDKLICFEYEKNLEFLLSYKFYQNFTDAMFNDLLEKDDPTEEEKKILNDTFLKIGKKIYTLNISAKEFVENLFFNNLRNILQLLHGKYKKDNCFFNLNNEDDIENIEKGYTLELAVNSFFIYIEKGKSELEKVDYKKALVYFNDALLTYAKNVDEKLIAYGYLGNTYISTEEYKKTIESYMKVIETNPKNGKAHFHMGFSYNKLKEYEKAIESYEKAIEINSINDKAYFNIGISFGSLKEHEKAIESYEKAIEINPTNDKSYVNMGIEYHYLKENEKAIESYIKAVEINSTNDKAYFNMGLSYERLNDNEKAVESYIKEIDINSESSSTFDRIIELYGIMDKPEEVVRWKNKKNDIEI